MHPDAENEADHPAARRGGGVQPEWVAGLKRIGRWDSPEYARAAAERRACDSHLSSVPYVGSPRNAEDWIESIGASRRLSIGPIETTGLQKICSHAIDVERGDALFHREHRLRFVQ